MYILARGAPLALTRGAFSDVSEVEVDGSNGARPSADYIHQDSRARELQQNKLSA